MLLTEQPILHSALNTQLFTAIDRDDTTAG